MRSFIKNFLKLKYKTQSAVMLQQHICYNNLLNWRVPKTKQDKATVSLLSPPFSPLSQWPFEKIEQMNIFCHSLYIKISQMLYNIYKINLIFLV